MPGLSTLLHSHTKESFLSTVIQAVQTTRSTIKPAVQFTEVIYQLSFLDERLYGTPGKLTNSGICILVPCRYSGEQKGK